MTRANDNTVFETLFELIKQQQANKDLRVEIRERSVYLVTSVIELIKPYLHFVVDDYATVYSSKDGSSKFIKAIELFDHTYVEKDDYAESMSSIFGSTIYLLEDGQIAKYDRNGYKFENDEEIAWNDVHDSSYTLEDLVNEYSAFEILNALDRQLSEQLELTRIKTKDLVNQLEVVKKLTLYYLSEKV